MKLQHWLSECVKKTNDQLAYNVITILWIISFHDFSLPYFRDFKLMILEHVAKVLDFYNKEKIVRITLMLFQSLMHDKECIDHMSMINALAIVTKLQNRVWVDAKITVVLESLWEQFDSNYQEFSSFDKWQKQVENQHFSWSTVHTEKFWRENSHCFSINAANLELISKEI